MQQKNIPGYEVFFGMSDCTYEDLLKDIPSWVVITFAVGWLGELNTPEPDAVKHRRIMLSLLRGYTAQQGAEIMYHVMRLAHDPNYGDGAVELFHKQYLLALIVRELKRSAAGPPFEPSNGKEYPIFLALLMIIDEVNTKGRPVLKQFKEQNIPDPHPLELLWPLVFPDFQHNEKVSPLYEMLKLNCLLDFVKLQWRDHLRSYLNSFNFDAAGQLAGSFKTIFEATAMYDPSKYFTKLAPIVPRDSEMARHLDWFSINSCIGDAAASMFDIKKRPLLKDAWQRYLVIEPDIFYKSFYRGPYFDLQEKIFPGKRGPNKFNSGVGDKVIEKKVFGAVMHSMKHDSEHFYCSHPAIGAPDCYNREEKVTFLMEMKSNILSEAIVNNPTYKKIVEYLDKHFASNSKNESKGTGQLINQLTRIRKGEFTFDPAFTATNRKRLTIYPVICHDDFHFGMFGINYHIQKRFKEQLDEENAAYFDIKPVTMIHLQWIFDFALRGGSFKGLQHLIDKYWRTIALRENLHINLRNTQTYIRSVISFDEMYSSTFIKDLPDLATDNNVLGPILEKAGITQANLNEIV